jgi:hypothetical protein
MSEKEPWAREDTQIHSLFLRLPIVLACLALLAACAGPSASENPQKAQRQALSIRALAIKNELPYAVTDVMVRVPATGAFAGCSNILARTDCRTSFQSVEYRGNPMVVSWKERGEPHKTDEFVVDEPEDAVPEKEVRLDVIIFAPGQAGAKLVQP